MPVLMLRYRGNGAYRPGLPARDIDRAELDAIAAGRKIDVDDLAEEATGSGLYLAVLDEPDVPRETTEPLSRHDELKRMVKAQLLEVATGLGLELPSRATNPQIIEAIEAEETRLAEEAAAAAAQASSSGEGDALAAILAERTDEELAAMAAEAGLADGLSRDEVIAALLAAEAPDGPQ